MKKSTLKKLSETNYNFYQTAGMFWNPSENYFWQGWSKLLPHIRNLELKIKSEKLKVLDLGCGNGRFANFLKQHFVNTEIEYTGLDSSDFLLTQAEAKKQQNFAKFEILKTDFLFDNWPEQVKDEEFDLVVAFGLLHHIPGYQNRLKILENARNLLDKNGLLILTTWQYLDVERLRKRVVSAEKRIQILNKLGIQGSELETGDNFLNWVKLVESIRFSHYFSPEELQKLLLDLKMNLIEKYQDDGRTGNVNGYFVLGELSSLGFIG